MKRIALVACLSAASGMAQPAEPPFLYQVSNSASYSSNIAQGSLFVVYGDNLGPAQLVQASSLPLPGQVGGTSITVVSQGTNYPCPMVYSQMGTAAAILPSNVPVGSATVNVTSNGLASPFPYSVTIVAAAPGLYTLGSSGLGSGVFTELDGSVNTFAASAKSGDVVTAWGTGLGPVSGSDASLPTTFPNFPGVEVYVGTQAANVIYAGRSGCCVALDQISFTIPSGVVGCYVPVAISSGGVLSNSVSIPVTATGGACSDTAPVIPTSIMNQATAGQPVKAAALAAGPAMLLQALGFNVRPYLAQTLSNIMRVKVSEQDVDKLLRARQAPNTRELARAMAKYGAAYKALSPAGKAAVRALLASKQQGAMASFGVFNSASTLAAALGGLFPSEGACTQLPTSIPPRHVQGLDAGTSIALTGQAGSWTLARMKAGQYQALFGNNAIGASLAQGLYSMSSAGGNDVPAFTAALNVGPSLSWTNKATVTTVNRSQPLTITWSGGTGYVVIGGYVNSRVGLVAGFACVAQASKETFTIPSFILSALPAASTESEIFVSPHPLSQKITIPGVDLAYFMDGSSDSKLVVFQ